MSQPKGQENRKARLETLRQSMRDARAKLHREWTRGIVRLGSSSRSGCFRGFDDPELHSSYLIAARALLDTSKGDLRSVALPILHLQRHALELALKQAIRGTLAHREAVEGVCAWEPKSLGTHNLKRLWHDLRDAFRRIKIDEKLFRSLEPLAFKLHTLDAAGTWARYRNDTEPVVLHLNDLQEELELVYGILFSPEADESGHMGLVAELDEVAHDTTMRRAVAEDHDAA